MKAVLLLVIRIYWLIIPLEKRRKCIFRESCSKYVYRVLSESGLKKGLAAFHFRSTSCRHGYQVFDNPESGKRWLLLSGGARVEEHEIAERLRELTS